MSAVFRRDDKEPIEVSSSWSLREQIADTDLWLAHIANVESVRGATLDIGFNARLNDTNVVVQGETVPLDFMRKLVEAQITLWLSIYPPFSESAYPVVAPDRREAQANGRVHRAAGELGSFGGEVAPVTTPKEVTQWTY